MSKVIIDAISPYLADIGIVATFVTTVCTVFSLLKNAFAKGELNF